MPSTEFETLSSSDDLIVVRDIETGHVFTMPVITTELGDRVLSSGSVVPSDQTSVRAEDIARRVWNHAQMQMHQAGRIDRVFIQ